MSLRATIALLILLSACTAGHADAYLTGRIGNSTIRMVMSHSTDGTAQGHYLYDRYDTPIVLQGRRTAQCWLLTEQDAQGRTIGHMALPHFQQGQVVHQGIWRSADGKRQEEVRLLAQAEFGFGKCARCDGRVIPASAATAKHYFELRLQQAESQPGIAAIIVRTKGKDEVVQEIPLQEAQYTVPFSVEVGDYDFDGHQDFSLMTMLTLNGTRIANFYLWTPKAMRFELHEGLSALPEVFVNAEERRVHSVSKGGIHTTSETYTFGPDRKLLLLSRHCIALLTDTLTGVESWEDVPCEGR